MAVISTYIAVIDNTTDLGGTIEQRVRAYSIQDALNQLVSAFGDVMLYTLGFLEPKKLSEVALEPSAPAVPTGLTATATGAETVEIDHDVMDRATFYEYTVAAANAAPLASSIVRYTAADLPLTVAGLTTATAYDFAVRAVNAYGASNFCTEVEETTE